MKVRLTRTVTKKELECLLAMGCRDEVDFVFIAASMEAGDVVHLSPDEEIHIHPEDYKWCWLFEKVGDNNYEES